jgi:uncharacterized protein YlaI
MEVKCTACAKIVEIDDEVLISSPKLIRKARCRLGQSITAYTCNECVAAIVLAMFCRTCDRYHMSPTCVGGSGILNS